MSRWRRPVAIVLVGLAVATTCVLLGRWQWNRHVVKDTAIAVIHASWSRPAVPLATLISPGRPMIQADEWRTVTVDGRYAKASTVLLRGRTVDGRGVFHVLVPLMADGAVLVVDRGTVPLGRTPESPVHVPTPPTGTVGVSVRLRVPEQATARRAPAGQVWSTDVAGVLAAAPSPVSGTPYAVIGQLTTERPAAADALGALPSPDTDPGPHLSYAFQWWAFAALAIGGFGAAARREWNDPHRTEPATRARRRGRDEIDEDALVDAQLEGRDQASWTRSR